MINYFVGQSYHRKSLFNPKIQVMLPLFPLTGTLKWSEMPEWVNCQKDYSTKLYHACCFIVLVDAELHLLFDSQHYLRRKRSEVEHSLVCIGYINGLWTLLHDGGKSQACCPPRQHISTVHTGNAKCTDCFWQLYCLWYTKIHSKKVYWQAESHTQYSSDGARDWRHYSWTDVKDSSLASYSHHGIQIHSVSA